MRKWMPIVFCEKSKKKQFCPNQKKLDYFCNKPTIEWKHWCWKAQTVAKRTQQWQDAASKKHSNRFEYLITFLFPLSHLNAFLHCKEIIIKIITDKQGSTPSYLKTFFQCLTQTFWVSKAIVNCGVMYTCAIAILCSNWSLF